MRVHTHYVRALVQVSILKGGEVCLEFPLNKSRSQHPLQDGRDHSVAKPVGEIMLVSANGMDVSEYTSFVRCSVRTVHIT